MGGRPVKIRASYLADAAYVARIARAVELDKARPQEWRKKVLHHLEEISALFMQARTPEAEEPRG